MRRYLAGFLIAALSAAACGDDAAPSRDPQTLVEQATARVAAADTFRFQVAYAGEPVIAEAGAVLDRVDGVFSAPDDAYSIVRLSALGLIGELEVVSDGADVWRRGPFTDEWEPMTGDILTAGDLFSDDGLLALLAEDISGLQAGEPAELEVFPGEPLDTVAGIVSGDRLAVLTLGYLQGERAQIKLYVAGDELRRVELVELDVELPRQWNIDLWAYDEPVDIPQPR